MESFCSLATRKNGFTFIELLFVAALIALIAGVWLFVSITGQKHERKDDQSQDYYSRTHFLQEHSRGMFVQRNRLAELVLIAFSLEIYTDVSFEGPTISTIQYSVENNGRTVVRIKDGKSTSYDFTGFKDADDFTFSITIPQKL